jgi:tetratricopeptide (TPR) repeat protein
VADEILLQEAIEAIRQEKFERARDILTRLLRADQKNPAYWLWMSAAVQTSKEKRYCLETVLRLDPDNELAKQGLALMGVGRAKAGPAPLSLPRRKWKVDDQIFLPQQESVGGKAHRLRRLVVPAVLLILIVLAGIGYALFAPRKAIPTYLPPTRTPGPPPTFTPTPTYIGFVAPPTPEGGLAAQPTPLWMLLEATYTPTPLYVNTPHPVSEAFRSGLLAYQQGAWETAISFFEQARQMEPQAADIPYYMGETFRLMGEPSQALQFYGQALQIDPQFAPALLGRARAKRSLNPKNDVLPDLNQALQTDPNLAEAYLERADVYLNQGEVPKALQDVEKAEALMPSSPLPPLMRAKIFRQQGQVQQAYQEAQKAFERDRTLLAAYRLLGETALLNGELEKARETLKIYLDYEKKDSDAYTLYGRSLVGLAGQEDLINAMLISLPVPQGAEDALPALTRAIELAKDNSWAYLVRSCVFLELGEGQKAVNDLSEARAALFQSANAQREPLWFAYHLALSRALLQAGRLESAEKQFNYAAEFARSNGEKAALYYWRGQAYLALDRKSLVQRDWTALLQLPAQDVPAEWRRTAQSFLATPTPTASPPVAPTSYPRTPSPAVRSPTPSRTATP